MVTGVRRKIPQVGWRICRKRNCQPGRNERTNMVQLPDQALASASAGRQTITRVATVPEPWHGAVNSLRRARHRPFIPDQHPRRGAKLLDELP